MQPELIASRVYKKWFNKLDDIVQDTIIFRIDRLLNGNAGDVKAVGAGVSELRIHYPKHYRVYYKKNGKQVILLLAGGDKTTQDTDIKTAIKLAKQYRINDG